MHQLLANTELFLDNLCVQPGKEHFLHAVDKYDIGININKTQAIPLRTRIQNILGCSAFANTLTTISI